MPTIVTDLKLTCFIYLDTSMGTGYRGQINFSSDQISLRNFNLSFAQSYAVAIVNGSNCITQIYL